MATVTSGPALSSEIPAWYSLEDAELLPSRDNASGPPTTVNTTTRIPLFPSYQFVIYAIRRFSQDHKAYRLDPDDPEKWEKWDTSRQIMQNILNRYYHLTPNARDLIDVCLEVWSAVDVCVMGFPPTSEQ